MCQRDPHSKVSGRPTSKGHIHLLLLVCCGIVAGCFISAADSPESCDSFAKLPDRRNIDFAPGVGETVQSWKAEYQWLRRSRSCRNMQAAVA